MISEPIPSRRRNERNAGEFEPAPTASPFDRQNIQAVRFGDLLDDTQTESGSIEGGQVAGFEDAFALVRRNPGAIVCGVETILQRADYYCHALLTALDAVIGL